MHDVIAELNHRYSSRTPLIALHTHERERGIRSLQRVLAEPAHAERGRALYTWTCRKGITQIGGGDLPGDQTRVVDATVRDGPGLVDFLERYCVEVREGKRPQGIFILCDLGPFVAPLGTEDPVVSCGLRDVAALGTRRAVTLVFLGPTFPALESLDREILHLDLPLPDERETALILTQVVEEVECNPKAGDLDLALGPTRRAQIVALLLGLTAAEMETHLRYAILTNRGLGGAFLDTLIAEKRQAVGRAGAVTWQPGRGRETLGGYHGLLALLEEMRETFTPAARAYGLRRAKGILAVGLPGTGKDHAMTVAASLFNLPLYRMDASFMGAGGGVLGQAEAVMKETLARVEAQPAILGISEFEKAFGGLASPSQSDGGAAARVGAIMLNWMAEQDHVFVFATANDISQLAPEQIRQGRFDQIVFFDLPHGADRAAIAAIHLRAARQDPDALDLAALAAATEGFSGAEIAAVVAKAARIAFRDGARSVSLADLVGAAQVLRPSTVAVMKKDEVQRIREWARVNGALDIAAASGAGVAPQTGSQPIDL